MPSPGSSTNWPGSDPTTPAPSSSDPAGPVEPSASPTPPLCPPSTRSPASPVSLQAIRYEHRVFLVGMTRSGKSTLARAMFLSAAGPRLVIDPADSSLTGSVVDEGGTYSDPRRPPNLATIRFVPRDPADRDAYDAVYRWAFANFPRYVWLDEPEHAAPANGWPRWANTFIVQGAKRMLGHLACSTRPREVMRSLIANAQHVMIFTLPNPDDRRHLAALVGVSSTLLDAELAALPEHGFLWWNVLSRTLTVCPPLPKDRALAL